MEQITVIFFSCRRLGFLREVVDSFIENNTYPIYEYIIVNDSADESIHEQLRRTYPDFTLVLNAQNVGLFVSIDLGLAHVKTDYYFLIEDDWKVIKNGFMEQAVTIMNNRKDIEEVWLADYNKHPMEPELHEICNVKYRMAAKDVFKDYAGYIYGWHGFATACALKRMSDYRKVAPYGKITRGWSKISPGQWDDVWHKEHAIGEEYNKLGYRTAILIDDVYAENIGIGKSEYVHGKELS